MFAYYWTRHVSNLIGLFCQFFFLWQCSSEQSSEFIWSLRGRGRYLWHLELLGIGFSPHFLFPFSSFNTIDHSRHISSFSTLIIIHIKSRTVYLEMKKITEITFTQLEDHWDCFTSSRISQLNSVPYKFEIKFLGRIHGYPCKCAFCTRLWRDFSTFLLLSSD